MAQSDKPKGGEMKDDVWVSSMCDMCYCPCGIKVHRVDGVVVKIEGLPDYPHNWGRLCPKGNAGLISLYDPHRVKRPLRRTNPEKGIGIDPQWAEIGWEEALALVSDKLKAIRNTDARKLVVATFDMGAPNAIVRAWTSAFGTPNTGWQTAGYFCGAALHPMTYITNASFHSEVDLDYCNYCILIGNQMGFMAGLNPNIMAQKMADARIRGMKLVVLDPVGANAAAKADEWIPIRPGTDAAFALAMIHVLLNERGIYDRGFLRDHTNGPYLVGPDGYYHRDPETQKPMVWDSMTGTAIPYDADLKDIALEGEYKANGVRCKTAFQLLREHVSAYTPERVAPITTVPAETIRRIAVEYGEAARIGSTIVIEGKELPYRPAAVNQYRGSYTHKHGMLIALAVQLLNMVIGAVYVPGGHRGINPVGPSWEPKEGPDGLMLPSDMVSLGRSPYDFLSAPVRTPSSFLLEELFPAADQHCPATELAILDPEKFQLPYKPELLIHCRTNLMMTSVEPKTTAEALKKIPLMVSFAREIDETVEFADIVFPEPHYLERLDPFPNSYWLSISPASGHWYRGIRQPVVAAPEGVRHWTEILIELADRLGFLEDFNAMLNLALCLSGEHKLETSRKHNREEISDMLAKSLFGADHDLKWFKEHGYVASKRKIEELYPMPFIKPRIPIYFEHLLKAGKYAQAVAKRLELPWDTSDYQPLPDWKPCPAYENQSRDFDLYAVNYTLPFHTFTHTAENPWLSELSEHHPYAYKIMINTAVARSKGIKDGDPIWIEAVDGQKIKGRAKVTECIHPEVVGTAGIFGSWAKGKPIARDKGAHFNSLLPLNLERMDMVSLTVDACVKVRVQKAEG